MVVCQSLLAHLSNDPDFITREGTYEIVLPQCLRAHLKKKISVAVDVSLELAGKDLTKRTRLESDGPALYETNLGFLNTEAGERERVVSDGWWFFLSAKRRGGLSTPF